MSIQSGSATFRPPLKMVKFSHRAKLPPDGKRRLDTMRRAMKDLEAGLKGK